MVKYKIYPTLLDSFYWYKRGYNPKEEIINKINRVKTEFPEAARKGVAFESVINVLLKSGNHSLLMDSEFESDGFKFDSAIVQKIAKKLCNAKKQQEFIQANVSTSVGLINVYGFIDYSYDDMFVDLKTTGSYKKDKCYPLLAQLNGRPVNKFNYLVTDFKDAYVEPYLHNSSMTDEFLFNLVEFTEFLEANRDLITDKKIFGL